MPVRTLSLPVQGLDDHDSVAIDDIYVPNLRNVRSDRSRIVQAPGGSLLCPPPLPFSGNPGYGASVGTFVKATATGNQTVAHNLGAAPVALVMMISGATALNTVTTLFHFGLGITDGTTSRSLSMTGLTPPGTDMGRRVDTPVLQVCNADGFILSTASFVSWSSSNFVINWTTNDGVPYQVSYVIYGGTGMNGKLLSWTLNGGTGNQSVTGAGFEPTLVMHFNLSVPGTGPFTDGFYNFGAMTATEQFAWGTIINDATVHGTSPSAFSYDDSDLCLVTLGTQSTLRIVRETALVSLDADGFTVDRILQPSGVTNVISLCLNGFANVKIGAVARPTSTAPVLQSVTGLGFEPSGLIVTTVGGDGGSAIIGLGDTVNQAVGLFYGANTTTAFLRCLHRTDMIHSDLTAPPTAGTQNAVGNLKQFDSDGFTLNWVTTNARRANLHYIAWNFSSSTGGEIGVIRNYGDLIVGGTTPTEKIVMLTSKSAFVYAPDTTSTGIWTPTSEAYTGTDVQRFSIANGTDATYGAVAAWSQGKNNIRYYDGSMFGDLVTSGTNHAARIVLPFNNRIVSVRPLVAGVDQKTQIRWSVNGDFSDWAGTGSGTLEVVETSNQALTGGIVLGSRCYLTRAREVVELIATGSLSPVFIPEVRVSGVGCIATHSMAAGDIYAFWLGPDEIYQWDGAQLKAVGGRTYNTITQLVDYESLDMIQGIVYTPDSQYWLVVPPFIFIYDYRREIWDWDDARSFEAIGILTVQDLITADLDHSEFVVIGDSSVQTVREDPTINTYLGAPIDSYFETKDFLPLALNGKQYEVSYDKHNTVWRIWFRGTPGEQVEVAISLDKGLSYLTSQIVTVNAQGVGIFFSDVAWGVLRIRFRSQGDSVYSIQGPCQLEFTEAGVMLPP